MRFLGIGAIVLVLFLLLTPLGVLIIVSEADALVTTKAPVDVDSAVNARRIAKQFYRGLMRSPTAPASQITLSEQDINGIIALAIRGISAVKGHTEISNSGLEGKFSLKVANNPFGEFINVTARIVPSTQGLVVDKLSVGGLKLSGKFLFSLVESVLNWTLDGEKLGTELLSTVESVTITDSVLTLAYRPIENFSQKLTKLKGQVQFGPNDTEVVRVYYQQLCHFQKHSSKQNNRSMGAYLSHTFDFAQQRSEQNNDAAEENRAALLALAIFMGSEKFDTFIGALDQTTCKPAKGYISVADRNDLRLHFIFSAALQVIANSGVSFSIGELKELLDSRGGGSGFSFADLAADRAGIRFAELAIDDAGAKHLQKMAAELTKEAVFFPTIADLPEGIRQQEFEQQGGIESEFYNKHLAIIEQRIDTLKLFQAR